LAAGKKRYPRPEALLTTALGGRVVCTDRTLLYEEAPDAYKNVTHIIHDLEAAGLIRVRRDLGSALAG
jgi:release factor H-coupled RctB family protein